MLAFRLNITVDVLVRGETQVEVVQNAEELAQRIFDAYHSIDTEKARICDVTTSLDGWTDVTHLPDETQEET